MKKLLEFFIAEAGYDQFRNISNNARYAFNSGLVTLDNEDIYSEFEDELENFKEEINKAINSKSVNSDYEYSIDDLDDLEKSKQKIELLEKYLEKFNFPKKDDVIRAIVSYYGSTEWHHIGSNYKRTDFYDLKETMVSLLNDNDITTDNELNEIVRQYEKNLTEIENEIENKRKEVKDKIEEILKNYDKNDYKFFSEDKIYTLDQLLKYNNNYNNIILMLDHDKRPKGDIYYCLNLYDDLDNRNEEDYHITVENATNSDADHYYDTDSDKLYTPIKIFKASDTDKVNKYINSELDDEELEDFYFSNGDGVLLYTDLILEM